MTFLMRMASHAHALTAALLAAGVLIGLGLRILQVARFRLESSLDRLPFALALGLAAAGTTFLAAGCVGALRPVPVIVSTGALALLAWPARGELLSTLRSVRADLVRAVPDDGLRGLGLIVAGISFGLLLLSSLAPPAEWDALTYHLDVPADYLASGWVHLPADNLHALFLGPVQLLYVPLLALGTPVSASVLNAIAAVAVVLLFVSAAAKLLSSEAAGLTLVVLWGNTVWVAVAGSPLVDGTLVLFTFLGLYGLLLSRSGEGGPGLFLASGLLLGAAVGVKLQALAFSVAVAPLVVAAAHRLGSAKGDRTALAGTLRWSVLFVAAGGVAAAPWLLRNQLLSGSPVYPLLSEPLLPPWIQELAGRSTVPATVDDYARTWLREMRVPFNLRDFFFAPWRLTVDYAFYSPLLLLLPLTLLDWRNRNVVWWLYAGVAFLLLILVPYPRTNLRYLMPVVLPFTVLSAHGLLIALRRLRPSVRMRIAVTLAYASILPTAVAAAMELPPALAYGAGLRSADEYMSAAKRPGELREILAEGVPSDGRVLMIAESRGFAVGRTVLQDNTGSNWLFLAATGAQERCLAGTGITHVLINEGILSHWVQRGLDRERLLGGFPEFERRCLRASLRSASFTLYEIVGWEGSPQEPTIG